MKQGTVSDEFAFPAGELMLWRESLDAGDNAFHEFIIVFADFDFVKDP